MSMVLECGFVSYPCQRLTCSRSHVHDFEHMVREFEQHHRPEETDESHVEEAGR
ncbi:hypothetical protein [Nocardia salmonicida]|uniref:hypothetical protein n=1 Tax=Nocardia salmonicida TaxID=53431 RepID=UPI0033FF317E